MHLIRCKGDKFRVDAGIGDTRHVASGDEMEQWWQEHGKEILLEGAVLCDGRRVYEHRPVRPEAGWKPSMAPSQPRRRACRRGMRPRLGRISYAADTSSSCWRIRRNSTRTASLVAPLHGSPRSQGRKWPGRERSGGIAVAQGRRTGS